MNDVPSAPLSVRIPAQRRGQNRIDAVLDEARTLLVEEGLAGFSIPVLAERLGFTRASIYNFFPTPYAVLNELARLELLELEACLVQAITADPRRAWRELLHTAIDAAVAFYARRPVARLLILGGPLSDDSYRALAITIQHLGEATQRLLATFAGIDVPQTPIGIAALAVDLGTTCMRQSVLLHGRITEAYAQEAFRVMERYLAPYLEGPTAPGPKPANHRGR